MTVVDLREIHPSFRTSRRGLPLHVRLAAALDAGDDAPSSLEGTLEGAGPVDHRDLILTLLCIYDLHTAPLAQVGDRARWQHHPVVAALKTALEDRLVASLDRRLDPVAPPAIQRESENESENESEDECAADTIRRLAAASAVPPIYDWLATEAGPTELVEFITLEGGPDAGFDDLVALCQIGLAGQPKLALARNYWDEMGRGNFEEIHTELHRRLTRNLEIRPTPRPELPPEALERAALAGLLGTNRWLQPEMVGALGVIELQAGPRCRRVVKALERVGAGPDAIAFYAEHAVADPLHGKDWLDNVVVPLAEDPAWAAKMIRGARWRLVVNDAFLAAVAPRFRTGV